MCVGASIDRDDRGEPTHDLPLSCPRGSRLRNDIGLLRPHLVWTSVQDRPPSRRRLRETNANTTGPPAFPSRPGSLRRSRDSRMRMMRNHRLSGVVVATLIGVGVVTQRPASHSQLPQHSGAPGSVDPLPPSALASDVEFPVTPADSLLGTLGHHTSATNRLVTMAAVLTPTPPLAPPAPPAPATPPAPAPPAPTPPAPAPTPPAPPAPTPPAPAPAPQAAATPAISVSSGAASSAWAQLRMCESGDNYGADTGNGYYGAYQFSLSTWQSLGYGGLPSQAAPAEQDAAAQRLFDRAGWSPWPVCSVELGL